MLVWPLQITVQFIVYGNDFQFIDLESDKLFSLNKEYEGKTLFAALSFSGKQTEFRNLKRRPFFIFCSRKLR